MTMHSLIKFKLNAMKIQINQTLKSRLPRKELLNFKVRLTLRLQSETKRKNKEKIKMNSKICQKKKSPIQIEEKDSEIRNGHKLKRSTTKPHTSFKRPRKSLFLPCKNKDSSKKKLTLYSLKFLNTLLHTLKNRNSNKNHGTEFSSCWLKSWLTLQFRLTRTQLKKSQKSATTS